MKPLGNRIFARPVPPKETTKGGLFIPEQSRDMTNKATVVAVGDGYVMSDGTLRPLEVKENDIVMYGKGAGQFIEVEGESYLLLTEDQISAVVLE